MCTKISHENVSAHKITQECTRISYSSCKEKYATDQYAKNNKDRKISIEI